MNTTKKRWTEEEDQQLFELVIMKGPGQWEIISNEIDGRNGKQCRERWTNQLNPLLKKTEWSIEESLLLFLLQQDVELKNQWSMLACYITGRTDCHIKNHWN